jgi:hypothetical protein
LFESYIKRSEYPVVHEWLIVIVTAVWYEILYKGRESPMGFKTAGCSALHMHNTTAGKHKRNSFICQELL